MDTERLDRLAERYAGRHDVSEFAMAVSQRGFEWASNDTRTYFIASTTKLFTTAIVMQLRAEKRLELDDPISAHLEPSVVRGLNVEDGTDRSGDIRVRDLLAHTSGIADYFEQKRSDGTTLMATILQEDRGWSMEEALDDARGMPARFAPGARGRAFYSDTNYQLLGALIERVAGDTYERTLERRIIEPLGLNATWLFTSDTLDRYDEVAQMRYGTTLMRIPLAMASFGPDGGLVSTAQEQLVFLRAFMAGELFPRKGLEEMTREWRRVFFPLEYGVGIMRFALPWYMSPGRRVPAMIGHSGASGAVLYHSPERDLFVAATVNQVKKRSLSYQLLARV